MSNLFRKMKSDYITRKEIAARLGMSVDFVRENEVRLGFRAARVTFSSRCIRYRVDLVEAAFRTLHAVTAATNRDGQQSAV